MNNVTFSLRYRGCEVSLSNGVCTYVLGLERGLSPGGGKKQPKLTDREKRLVAAFVKTLKIEKCISIFDNSKHPEVCWTIRKMAEMGDKETGRDMIPQIKEEGDPGYVGGKTNTLF